MPTQRLMATVYVLDGDEILLLYRRGSRVIADSFTGTAGGHMEPHEIKNARACVMRELFEETGLSADDITEPRLRYMTVRHVNGEIRINYYFFAGLCEHGRVIASREGDLHRFPIEDAASLDMPFSAKFMYRHWLETGRFDERLWLGAATHDSVVFTPID